MPSYARSVGKVMKVAAKPPETSSDEGEEEEGEDAETTDDDEEGEICDNPDMSNI